MIKGRRSIFAAAAVASLAIAPVVSATAASRSAAPVTDESGLGGGAGFAIVALGVLAAFIAITIVTNEEGDDPASP